VTFVFVLALDWITMTPYIKKSGWNMLHKFPLFHKRKKAIQVGNNIRTSTILV